MKTRIEILGIGSPFHPDQAAMSLVEGMRRDGFFPGIEGVEFAFGTLDRPGWGLLEFLRETEWGILVDAMVSGRKPGSVSRLDIDTLPLSSRTLTSHEVGLLPVLAVGRSLGLLPRGLILYGIEIDPPPFPDPATPREPSLAVASTLRDAIQRDIASILAPESVRERR